MTAEGALVVLYIGLVPVRAGLIEPERARRTTNLAWPRIVTGLARMSKNAADIAVLQRARGVPACPLLPEDAAALYDDYKRVTKI